MPDDADALSQFVERLTAAQGPLHACIHTLMAGAPDAADVLQETNRVLWRKAADYDPARPFLPWAYRVARLQVLAHRQGFARERLVFDEELIGRLADEFAGQSQAGERELRALEECLRKLPPAHHELVDARYQHGEAVNHIATRLDKPVNAVSALLYLLHPGFADEFQTWHAKLHDFPVSRITNLSIFASITTADPLFTVGTVIGGTGTSGSKPLLVRAAGPALAQFGVNGALTDPGSGVIGSNDNWGGTAAFSAAFAEARVRLRFDQLERRRAAGHTRTRQLHGDN